MRPMPPLSPAPEAVAELYARLVDARAERVPTAFARSVLAVLNAVVAHDFAVPEAFFGARLARPTAPGDTLYDVLAGWPYHDFTRWIEASRRTALAHIGPPDEPRVWRLPVHVHFVRAHAEQCFVGEQTDDDLLDDLARFDAEAARLWRADRVAFARRCSRPFVEWRLRRNLERADHDFGESGAREAIGLLRRDFLPYNDWYETCIERVGSPGLRFEVVGSRDIVLPDPLTERDTGWLEALSLPTDAINLLIPAPGQNHEDFAALPQCAFAGPVWRPALQQRGRGLAVVRAAHLGHVRRPGRRFADESGSTLVHELGHLFQLHHLGHATLHDIAEGRDDFDHPHIGVEADTLWRHPGLRVATRRPERALFVRHLHSRSMFFNIMTTLPQCDDSFFFTRGQAARARLFCAIHYGDIRTPAERWEDAPRWVARRTTDHRRLLAARFDAPLNPIGGARTAGG